MSPADTELSSKSIPENGNAETISLDDARQILAQEQLLRLQQCQAALGEPQTQINQILQDHNCVRVIEGQLPSGTWVPVSDLGFVDVRIRIVSGNDDRR